MYRPYELGTRYNKSVSTAGALYRENAGIHIHFDVREVMLGLSGSYSIMALAYQRHLSEDAIRFREEGSREIPSYNMTGQENNEGI